MKKIIGLLLFLISTNTILLAQLYKLEHKNKLDCAKDFEEFLKKNHAGFYGVRVEDRERAKYFNEIDRRIWVLPVNGDTIFCDKAEILYDSRGAFPTNFFLNKKVVFTPEEQYVNMKACCADNKIYEPFKFSDEMIAQHKLDAAYKKVSFLCEYITENKKIKYLKGFIIVGIKNYHLRLAIDKQSGEVVDFIEGSKVSNYDEWNKMVRAFEAKHIAVDCEIYKEALKIKTTTKENKKEDVYGLLYLLWINAQRKCEGLPNAYDLVKCYYQNAYESK